MSFSLINPLLSVAQKHKLSKQIKQIQGINENWQVSLGNTEAFRIQPTWNERNIAIYNTHPVLSLNKRFVVVGDIILYNHLQLCRKWQINPKKSCLELVAQLLEHHTDPINFSTLITNWHGLFNLVIWDQVLQQLILVRDPVGAKTIYYAKIGSIYWISPRLRSLSKYCSKELNLAALRDYLCCAFVPGEQTLWKDIQELRPGQIVILSETLKSPQIQYYWQAQEVLTNTQYSLEDYAQKLRLLLETVVQEALPEREPVGTYLSGGIDSSCVTALAAQLHHYPVQTYSIHFGTHLPNELEFSSCVANHCQTQHHILEITPEKMWHQLPITLAHLDDPIGDPLTVPNYLLGQLVRQDVRVILNGEGGDPCFAGPKNKPMLLSQLYGNPELNPENKVLNYLNSFQKCAVDLPTLLKPEISQTLHNIPSIFAVDLDDTQTQYLNRLMLLNIKFKGADHILTKVNNLAQAAQIEARSPLFDRRIVELSLQVPPQYKLQGSVEKAVLKQAVSDLLPAHIIHRPKSGMMVPVGYWFRHTWKQRTRALLLDKNAEISPYLNQNLIRDWLNYRGDINNRYGIKLWLLLTLEIWLQIHNR
jgi:asparagine synthase (glutamine-hydrolysing)